MRRRTHLIAVCVYSAADMRAAKQGLSNRAQLPWNFLCVSKLPQQLCMLAALTSPLKLPMLITLAHH